MKPILFTMPGNEAFAVQLGRFLAYDRGNLRIHIFPDGESCPRFATPVTGRDVVFMCALDRPDNKILALYLAACVARELGARSVGLVVPYLPYMRQDARFQAGEGITSLHFARLISSCCDWLVTVDPHLHRHRELSEIYGAATKVVHAAPEISKWIAANVRQPIVVGPDSESEQWVAEVARGAKCPYTVLQKKRSGDRLVEVSVPDASEWSGMTPVLVDDIVSTAHTIIAAIMQLEASGMVPPVCIAIHPLFADDAYAALHALGIGQIVSCNTVEHPTNKIDVYQAIAATVAELIKDRYQMD